VALQKLRSELRTYQNKRKKRKLFISLNVILLFDITLN